MLFVAFATPRPGTLQQRLARRLQWRYPEGVRPVAEYWLQGSEYDVVSIVEADSVAPIMATLAAWDDLFDFRVAPAVTADEGLRLAQQMAKS